MTEDLVIVGAGGTSQEIAEAVEHSNDKGRIWNLLGYLDDDPAKVGRELAGYPVIGTLGDASRFCRAKFIVGVANAEKPGLRKTIMDRLALPLDRFATIIHPSAHVSRHASVGRGVAILQDSVVSVNAKIGNHVIIGQMTSIGHDDVLEDYVTVAPAAVLSGFVRIREGAFVGATAAIIPRATIGEGALVGIGAVVIMDVDARLTVFGNPARPMPTFR